MILPFLQHQIRVVHHQDAPQLAALYAPFVNTSEVSFETTAPDTAEFERRITECLLHYPWFVLENEKTIVGYAYASPQGTRAAYGWNAQYSVYLADCARGTGAANALYFALEETLKIQGYKTAYALITQPNEPSRKFHIKWGFRELAVHQKTGYKNGKWIDVLWLYKQLGEYAIPTSAVIAFSSLKKESIARITNEATLLCR